MSEEGETKSLTLEVREWPPGHRLFTDTETGLHMSFDPPESEMMFTTRGGDQRQPAIMMRIDPARNTCTILAVDAFATEKEALEWFMNERGKHAH